MSFDSLSPPVHSSEGLSHRPSQLGKRLSIDTSSHARVHEPSPNDGSITETIPDQESQPRVDKPLTLLDLPSEILRKILQELLCFEQTADVRQEPRARDGAEHEYRTLTADLLPPSAKDFGFMLSHQRVTLIKTNFHPKVLLVCKKLAREGLFILRLENKWIAVEGLDNYVEMDGVLEFLGKFQSWKMERMRVRGDKLQGIWSNSLPDINIVTRLSKMSPKRLDLDNLTILPVGCLKFVCRAIQHLPAATALMSGEPAPHLWLSLSFPSGLVPQFLGQQEGRRHTDAFRKTLLQTLIRPLGKSVKNVDTMGNSSISDGSRLPSRSDTWFINRIKQCRAESAEVGLGRALRQLGQTIKKGDLLAVEQKNFCKARSLFFTAKRMIYTIASDGQ